jgi:hypothetical protein
MPYLKSELRKSKSNKFSEADLNEIHDLTMTQTSKNGSAEEPEFFKKYSKRVFLESEESSERSFSSRRDSNVIGPANSSMTHDVIGKPLSAFYRLA